MFEYHDHPGDDHDDVAPPETDAPADRGADAFTEHELPPLGDLPAHADTAPELLFPGDDATADAGLPGEADPAAPFPDDATFTQWLAGHEDGAADAPAELLPAAPEDGGALPSSGELVDWTLRKLGEDG